MSTNTIVSSKVEGAFGDEPRLAPRTSTQTGDSLTRFHNPFRTLSRRWQRERRRRAVGRAYDMALEIARFIPVQSEVLDVGCGNGFISHHLSAMIGTAVKGIDLATQTGALISYQRYDGRKFPIADKSVDALLLCYVLHHTQDTVEVLKEMRRTLRDGGLAVIYEDIPKSVFDRFICWVHNQQWRHRTGPCRFRQDYEWRRLFASVGFLIESERPLSRWRNFSHPISRRLFVLRYSRNEDPYGCSLESASSKEL